MLELEREWGKAPGWFASLDDGARAKVWALRVVEAEERAEADRQAKQAANRQAVAALGKRGKRG